MRHKPLNPSSPILQLSAIFLAAALGTAGCSKSQPEQTVPEKTTGADDSAKVDVAAMRPKARAFCGACHAVPHAATFPRNAWYEEVAQGYRFYEESRRSDLSPPPMNSVVAYYRRLAPERLPAPEFPPTPASRVRFVPQPLAAVEGGEGAHVSFIFRERRTGAEEGGLLFCDMRSGDVRRIDEGRFPPRQNGAGRADSQLMARLSHPAHVEPSDLDGDGQKDYVVAELGSFLPADHTLGKVVWLRPRSGGGQAERFEVVVLKSGLGRVADVRPADFDGDGDQDLVVAEFGWRKTGRILLLKQTGRKHGLPQFETVVLDKRHGTIHVPVADLNGDGKPDFVALVSQEHETVEAFLNAGDGTFTRKTVFRADDPSFGSSGIQLVDLDGDGDLDVLYTNGDSLDSFYLKPYHAVHWLENRGAFPFAHHELTKLPGAIRALAADLDGDGDLDVVAAAWLPGRVINAYARDGIDVLIWLEQRKGGRFVRHRIARSTSGFMSLSVGDFDGDGVADVVSGHFEDAGSNWLTLWRKRRDGSKRSP